MIKRFLNWLGIGLIQETEVCETCALLKDSLDYERLKSTELLEFERSRNRELTNAITELIKPVRVESTDTSNLRPILSRHTPFSARRNQLERESANRAEQIRKDSPLAAKADNTNEDRSLRMPITAMAQTVEELEAELSIEEK